jgi:hypothetical protein
MCAIGERNHGLLFLDLTGGFHVLSGMRWNGAACAQQVHTSQFGQSASKTKINFSLKLILIYLRSFSKMQEYSRRVGLTNYKIFLVNPILENKSKNHLFLVLDDSALGALNTECLNLFPLGSQRQWVIAILVHPEPTRK